MTVSRLGGALALVGVAIVGVGGYVLIQKDDTVRSHLDLELNEVIQEGEMGYDYTLPKTQDNPEFNLIDKSQLNLSVELESGETATIIKSSEESMEILLDTTTGEHQLNRTVLRGNEILGYVAEILDSNTLLVRQFDPSEEVVTY